MKKYILIIFMVLMVGMAMAQDVIVKKDGSTILSKVEEINGTEIKYRKWTNLEGPIYSINRSEVLSINYRNGEIEKIFDESSEHSHMLDSPIYTGEKLEFVFNAGTAKYYVFQGEKELTLDELRMIIGKEGYEDFMKGDRLIQTGSLFLWPYKVTGVIGTIGLIAGYVKKSDGTYNHTARMIGYVGVGVAVPCLVAYWVLTGSGKNRINETINEYNSKSKSVSFDVYPQIMRFNTLQSDSEACIGLTFSMTF